MRLYIPTSSLNADNILSCESIAPAYECRKRKFGYSHFDLLPELELYNKVTLAFTKIPTFHTFDSDRENFAMVVAVDVDDFEKFGIKQINSVNDVDVYATCSPILLTPSTTRFLFFDNRAKEYTLHSCADSAKSKLFDFYKLNFLEADRRFYGESLRAYINKIDVLDREPLFSENRFDKAKGFIWGYGMGSMMSIPKDVALLLKIQKRIYDIVSSTKNEDYIPASLSEELSRLDNEFYVIDPNQKNIKNAWEVYIKGVAERFLHVDLKTSDIDEFLKQLGAENLVKNKFLTDNQYTLRKKLSDYIRIGSYGYETYSHDIQDYTERLMSNARNEAASNPFFQSLDVDTVSYDTVMMSADDRTSKLFNKILSRIIWDNLIPSLEELRVNKANVAKSVVIAIKGIIEELGEQWTDAPIQIYFNDMRKNISDFTEFNFNKINDVVLQSVAAFLLKGEDFDSLKQYLETNAFSNYCYAFALWGAVSGYVSIPRSIIESEFSKFFIAKLFEQSQTALNLNAKIAIPTSKPNEAPRPINNPVVSNTVSFRNRVIAFFEKIKKGKKNQDLMKEELFATLNQLGDSDNGFLFVCTLNDFSKWRNTSKAWKEMQAEFCPDYAEQRGKKHTENQRAIKPTQSKGFPDHIGLGGLFSGSEEEIILTSTVNNDSQQRKTSYKSHSIKVLFIHDVECWHSLERLIPNELHESVRSDLIWFQSEYQKGAQSHYYAKARRDNQSTIEAFLRYMGKKRYSHQLNLETIGNYLKELYGR